MKKGGLFKTVRVMVVLLVSVAIAVVLVQLRPRAEKQDRPEEGRLVAVMRTQAQTLPMVVEAYGTVAPREALKLVAEVRGQVAELHSAFAEGGYLSAGEVLVTIDPRDYELALRRAQASIRQAKADLKKLAQDITNLNASLELARSDVKLARAEADRMQRLVQRKMVAQSAVDKADRQLLASRERLQGLENQLALTGPNRNRLQGQLEMARVSTDQAELDLDRCRISTPFNAWVTAKAVEKGQHVTVGQQVGAIYRAGAFDIEVKIPVGELDWFSNGANGGVGAPATVVFSETIPQRTWPGRVGRIKAALDQATRTLPVVIEVGDSPGDTAPTNGNLKPGMFVTVRIQGRPVENVHALPRHLIRDDDTVFVAIKDQLEIRAVTILRRFKTEVLVSEGLADGDLVITSPVSGAIAGMKIRLKTEDGGRMAEDRGLRTDVGGQRTED